MIVETSAFVAILGKEPLADRLVSAIRNAGEEAIMSAASYVESCIVVDSQGKPVLSERVDTLLNELGVTIVPITVAHARHARHAYRLFGKGTGHKASLNFGDCFAYALAKETGERILFVGDDFGHTDLFPMPY